jgi:hypothetical protein
METPAMVTRNDSHRARTKTTTESIGAGARRGRLGVQLSDREVGRMIEQFNLPPFLTLAQAADICQLKPGTLKNQVCQDRFDGSAIKGKPLCFITTRFLQEFAGRLERRN